MALQEKLESLNYIQDKVKRCMQLVQDYYDPKNENFGSCLGDLRRNLKQLQDQELSKMKRNLLDLQNTLKDQHEIINRSHDLKVLKKIKLQLKAQEITLRKHQSRLQQYL
jgi:hypothetical protein